MKTKFAFIGAALAACMLLSAGAQAATELRITISGNGDPTTVFDVVSNPTPSNFVMGVNFALGPLTQIINGSPITDYYYFYSNAQGGALSDNFYYNDYGAQIYSGSESNPTFILGSTSAYNYASGIIDTINVSGVAGVVPSVPEASTWGMMLVGFASIGFAGYRRRKGAALPA